GRRRVCDCLAVRPRRHPPQPKGCGPAIAGGLRQPVRLRRSSARTSGDRLITAMRILVTGGAGFIGSALIRHLISATAHEVVNVDKLTYAGTLTSLDAVSSDPRYDFARVDGCDQADLARVFERHNPDIVVHLAAESHVDRSIDGPEDFVRTNVLGTFAMLSAALRHWQSLAPSRREAFRFHHVSTDEVYGSLGPEGLFSETSPYDP